MTARWPRWLLLLPALALAAACAPAAAPEVQQVEVTKVVEVERVVEREVEKEVLVTPTPQPVTLSVLTHWPEEQFRKPFESILAAYMAENPHVTIENPFVDFAQLQTKIVTARTAGITPDVYHFYNLWMPEFVASGLFDAPPAEIVEDIRANYTPSSVRAASYADQVWGYPTEVNTYLLQYNRCMLEEAGFSAPPATWAELVEQSTAVTRIRPDGTTEQSGFVFLDGWDSGVVHPFLSFLWSNGGEYLDAEGRKPMFNSPQALEVLEMYRAMRDAGAIDPAVELDEFPAGKAAFLVMAPWTGNWFRGAFVDGPECLGVAQLPEPRPGVGYRTVQYNWLFAVDNGSKNREEAWRFVRWLNTPRGDGSTPIGQFLVKALAAIPSRQSDIAHYGSLLADEFMAPFVASLERAIPEPVVPGGQEVKTILQVEIEQFMFGNKTAQQALGDASIQAEAVLAR